MDLRMLRSVVGEAPLPDVAACRRELEHVRAARGMLDAREVAVLGRLDELTEETPSVFPEEELAAAAKTSRTKASRVRNRRKACNAIPELADALADGRTTGDRSEE
ncbi:MAG TPA: hypothetical protein DCR14_00140, partial [Acidimicrobiaceae bacterium]|nr:hypothetical protein [Acidimicrobiaceae bacterium]